MKRIPWAWVLTGLLVLAASITVLRIDGEGRRVQREAFLTSVARDLDARFFSRHRSELEWLAAQPVVREFLLRPRAPSEELRGLLVQTAGLLDIEVAYLVSPEGTILAATDPTFLGADLSSREYVRKGVAGLRAYGIGMGLVTKTPGLYASVPVFGEGRVVGLAVFRTSDETLHRWQALYPGTLILTPEGRVFSSTVEAFRAGSLWSSEARDQVTVQGRLFLVERLSLDAVPGYALVSLTPETWPWGLLVTVDLLVILSLFAGFSIRRQWLAARKRQTDHRERLIRERLLSHLLEGIAVFDHDAKMVWANPVFEKLIGHEAGMPFPSLGELWDRPGPGPWQEVLENRRPWVVFESVLRGGNEGWIPVSAGFTAAEGGFLLSVLDGTDRYRSDQLLRQSQKLTVLGQLSGGIAHDLNNMLGVLMGMADLLKMSLPEQDPLQESVDLILTTLARAAGLSEKMLTFARQTPIQRVPLDTTALLRELRFLARTALPEGTRAEIHAPDGPLLVSGDENLLLSALLNLILNAGEAMASGGLVKVVGQVSGTNFVIVVKDNGQGMDKATLARIFEPFFTTKPTKGTGLGLSLVRRTILEHKGTIDVRSAPGEGTTVTVTLPLS